MQKNLHPTPTLTTQKVGVKYSKFSNEATRASHPHAQFGIHAY